MLRAIFFLSSALVSIGLVYAFGVWVLLALFGAMVATLLFSTKKVSDVELPQGDGSTGYQSTVAARF